MGEGLAHPKLVVPNRDLLTSRLSTTGSLHIILDPISDLLNEKWEWGPPNLCLNKPSGGPGVQPLCDGSCGARNSSEWSVKMLAWVSQGRLPGGGT